MADIFPCVECNKNKSQGRFTRPKPSSGLAGWSKGFSQRKPIPYWYCYTCLPYGQGRGEDDEVEMAKRAPTVEVLPAGNKIDLVKSKAEGLQLISPLQVQIDELEITDAESYQLADFLLSKIGAARKTWASKMEPIIKPIRSGLDALYALNRDVDRPLEALDKQGRAKMVEFKTEERRQLQAANEIKEREEQRLRNEAAAAELKAQTASTPQLRGRLASQANKLTEQAEAVAQQETAAPIIADRSTERTPRKVRVHDLGLAIQGILDGTIPPELVVVDQVWLNRQHKADAATVEAWPGCEGYDDLQIVRR